LTLFPDCVQIEAPVLIATDMLDATLPPVDNGGEVTITYQMEFNFTIIGAPSGVTWEQVTFTVVQDGEEDENHITIMYFRREPILSKLFAVVV